MPRRPAPAPLDSGNPRGRRASSAALFVPRRVAPSPATPRGRRASGLARFAQRPLAPAPGNTSRAWSAARFPPRRLAPAPSTGGRAWIALALALLALLPALALAQDARSLRPVIAARYPSVRWVRTATLAAWVRDGAPLVLLDARQAAEHRVSHLAGAHRVDPDHPDVTSLAIPRGARVVVYCSVGWRSASVADALRQAGYRDVHNLEGGIFAWANEGRPLVRDGHAVRVVHPYDETWGRMLRRELHAYAP